MSARSRPRANHNQDTDEERRLWKEIKDKARDVDDMVNKSNTLGTQILEAESTQAALVEDNKPTDATLDDKLEKLYRENLKLCEEVQHILEGSSHDMPLLDSIKILAGLREASEESALAALAASQTQRSASGKASRPNKKSAAALKASNTSTSTTAVEDDDNNTTSTFAAAPSPRIHLSTNSRLKASEAKSSRASSLIPHTRETSVKLEDGAETPHTTSTTTSTDQQNPKTKSPATTTATADPNPPTTPAQPSSARPPRLSLRLNEIVFHRHKDPSAEGEGILCRVTSVIGEGKQRRYEIQDVDASGPNQPSPMRASVANLMQIPQSNRGLGDLGKGKQVLAQYPDTTTFYRAEVSVAWRARDLEEAAGGGEGKEGLVRLRFEGETEDILSEVERRFVLTEK